MNKSALLWTAGLNLMNYIQYIHEVLCMNQTKVGAAVGLIHSLTPTIQTVSDTLQGNTFIAAI